MKGNFYTRSLVDTGFVTIVVTTEEIVHVLDTGFHYGKGKRGIEVFINNVFIKIMKEVSISV